MGLSWEKPKDDGGGKITGYVVEKKPKGSDDWEEAMPVVAGETKCKVRGTQYMQSVYTLNVSVMW